MNNENENENEIAKNYPDDLIDIKEIINTVWHDKWIVIFSTIIFLIIATVYSYSLQNIYQSKALLSPVGEQNAMNEAVRGYSGLASLAGINIPSSSNSANSTKALKKINSLSFFKNNIFPNIFLPDLMAIKSWDKRTNSNVYDNNIFDISSGNWVRDFKYPQTQIPSVQEAYKIFLKDHIKIIESNDTGFVTISIAHKSPFIAKAWTDLVVNEINNFYRVKDKSEAIAATEYLNKQISQTSLTEVKQVIASLLQQKTQQLTLIEVSDSYVFEYIDSPVVMEEKHEPNRIILILLISIAGSFLGIVIIFIRRYQLVSSNI
jgi:LPS O-antigen subunit length determinant protein (WzzB/FepE family)